MSFHFRGGQIRSQNQPPKVEGHRGKQKSFVYNAHPTHPHIFSCHWELKQQEFSLSKKTGDDV